MASKPRVLILGGCGFVGRNLVHYLVENDLCTSIRVVDKVFPETAYLDAHHKASFESDVVEYIQGNLVNQASIEKCFTCEEGEFQIVFNLAAETKYGQVESVYKEKVLDLALKCATEAAKRGVERFVELSSGQVYDSSNKPKAEDAKTKPWTHVAEYSLQKENALREMEGLNVVFVRPATIYGPGDVAGISPRIICAAVYKKLDEKMLFLWDSKTRMNTVHVRDVVKALWHLSTNGEDRAVFNLCDKGDTDQQAINEALERIFNIKAGFHGTMKSKVLTNIDSLTTHVNDKHLKPWSDLCREAGVGNTPLTPYLDKELLVHNHLCLDGSAIEATGFVYDHPTVTDDLLREQIEYFTSQNIFPSTVLE